ncbi:hypothetical protein EXIGLDRAFT_762128 [Exidia glandulosa HHB12029]|uniref:Uncharacterized protein n=1 Tax=Exidia glandulosa HHB12029 TaxID=1314781 RepID=A0A166BD12_EXIGL|nr:hypothetical protein EXIGLDRAFT_762128 [Exidia glandulosa HHB12029]
MGRAFLSTPYIQQAPAPRKVPETVHRWSARNFDPDQEEIDGLDMVYEAVVVPDAPGALPESAVRTRLDIAAVVPSSAAADDASNNSDADSDSGTAISSPSSVTSNEAQQLASLQRRLFGEGAGARAGPGHSVSASDTARRVQDHMATMSSMFDRVSATTNAPAVPATTTTTTGRGPRRAATLSALDIVTRPAVAQSI